MNFARLAVDRPVATTMLVGVLVVLGLFAYKDIPIDLFPRVDMPFVTIITVYPGASPLEIESLITDPLEEAVSSISGIDTMTSNSLEGVSQIMLEFDMEVDQDTAAMDVREKIDLVIASLPDEADEPKILKLDINASAVVQVAVFGSKPIGDLTRFVEDEVEDALAQVPGVADVELIGARQREIRILFDEERLAAYGLSIVHLSNLIAQKSLELPGGRLVRSEREWTIRVAAKFDDVDTIAAMEIPTPSGQIIQLAQLAEIRDAFEDERQRAFFNGHPAVQLAIKKRADANAPAVAAAVRTAIDGIIERLPPGIELAIVNDRSEFTIDALNEVSSNLVIGVVLTAIILLVFLGSLRSTFIAATAMPASIVATMFLVNMAGFTLNLLTTMALAITVGILVNNAIVVLENITKKVDAGVAPADAAVSGTSEIAVAVMGATLTNVVVFVPIAFMGGVVGQFFYSFGMTAAFSTIISLFISFTLTPMLAALLVKKSAADERSAAARWFDTRYQQWEREYRHDIDVVLSHPVVVVLATASLMVIPILLGPYLGFEFIAESDQGEFIITFRRPSGVSLESTTTLCRQIEGMMSAKIPEIERIASRIGKIDSLFGASEGVELGQVKVYTSDKNDRARGIREIVESIRADLASLPGVTLSIEIPDMVGSKGAPLQVEVLGQNLDEVVAVAGKVRKVVAATDGAVDVDSTWRTGRPEIEIRPDRIRCERAGLSMAYLARSIRGRYAGLTPVTYREGADEFDVRLLLTGDQRHSLTRVADLTVVLPSGTSIPIQTVADVRRSVGPSTIVRKERKKAVVITGFVKGRSYGDVLTDVQRSLARLDRPSSVVIRYMGDAKRMGETFAEIGQAFLLAVILTYMLLAGLLESFMVPLLILASLPLAFVGIIPALLICDMNVAMFPLMAVVMLVGIVVNNGILLVENFRDHRQRGSSLREAVLAGAPERLRPILMTTIAAALAMVPLALGQGAGGEMRAPMAVVSIGGLLVSMMLSLYLIPLFYYLWEGRRWPRFSSSQTGMVLILALLVNSVSIAATLPAGVALDEYLAIPEELTKLAREQQQDVGSKLLLRDCVRQALADNDLIAAARHALAASQANVRIADAARLGSFAATVSRVDYNDDLTMTFGKEKATAKNIVYDLPLYSGGAIEAGRRMARHGQRASQQQQEMTRQDVVHETVTSYYALLQTQWLVVLARANIDELALQLETVEARITAGAAVESERLRVEVALAEARERLISADNRRRRAMAALNLAMASPIDKSLVAIDPKVFARLREEPAAAFLRIRTRHPQLARARAALRLKAQELTAAKAALKPKVGLNVTYGDVNPLFAGETMSTQVLLAAELPLYKGGEMRAAIEQKRKLFHQAREELEFLERRLRFSLFQAHLDVEEAWKRIEVSRHAVQAASENARITSERYQSGAAIVLELVDAQFSLLVSRTSLLRAIIDHALALVRYHHAAGDIWQFFPAPENLVPTWRQGRN